MFMNTNITSSNNGFGTGLRESRDSIRRLMKTEGYEWKYYKNFIITYEKELLAYHNREKEKDSKD